MLSVHKRNRIFGRNRRLNLKTRFLTIGRKERARTIRYQNYLLQIKRNDLSMRKQLHNTLRFFDSERGSWYDGDRGDLLDVIKS